MKQIHRETCGKSYRNVYRLPNNYGLSIYGGSYEGESVGIIYFSAESNEQWDVINEREILEAVKGCRVYGNEKYSQTEVAEIVKRLEEMPERREAAK